MRFRHLVCIILVYSCTPVSQTVNPQASAKVLSFTDATYESQIKTALVHPDFGQTQEVLLPAVTEIGKWNLVLEFDDLRPERDNYYVRIVHCNFDWTKSTLMDLDFMTSYNEIPVNNFEYSVDTHIPYVHYWVQLPEVKLPGNYLAVVYRGSDRNDVILSKRFMVFDRKVAFASDRNLIGAGSVASVNQQLNFTVSYRGLEINNPLQDVRVVIRQNQRWDNLISDVRPAFVREIEKQLEYRFFDDTRMFKGGNEFRFFDIRSLNYPGRNVARVDKTVRPYEVYIDVDKPRTSEAYGQYRDMNGGYVPENLDYRDAGFSNYAYVNFTLSSKPLDGDVYVTGGFHHWNLDKENLMAFDSTKNVYSARLLLKQGWYDYQYVVKSKSLPFHLLEGSHFETENLYEIFVYHRPFQPRADLLVGYLLVEKNPR